ncbi:ATP-grasp domain-containing protein [Citrobacter freundii]|nr:ATP-grasp domain-containing protein [Citrobacter freundii]MBJ8869545.1 ATP-grasp domain-containing protein [Citrobacter braakii]MBJ8900806.1 ATP-grasp domain-containing protein [Citrobacter braakii]MBJ8905461.1 ATP-grasp domain-containing protein [Citrobacter braakii]MBJ8922418.1 ATP-grasp domain-containing protein [Citrobacter braakii]
MEKIFLQIGATRDGQNPYCEVARRNGYFTVLVETGEFVDYQSQCMSLPFDMILRIDHPENPVEVLQTWLYTGRQATPQVVLAGFEAYNQSAGRIRGMLNNSPENRVFIPLDKYAQRMTLKKSGCTFSQPDFHFFSSVHGIKNARNCINYPCVIKPIDGGGGLGIWLVKTPATLDDAVNKLAMTMNYGGRPFSGFIVEDYLQGEEYSLQGVVCNGEPWVLTCCQKVIETAENSNGNISFYESGHVASPAHNLPEPFRRLMHQCCENFGYQQGAFHIDFIMVKDTPYFLEMGFRLSGMGVVSLVKEVTGLNWAEIAFNIEQEKPYENISHSRHSFSAGQLRLRQAAHLSAAELWVNQNRHGHIVPPVKFPQPDISSESPLYADLTRHAGILGILHLTADDPKEILSVFQDITSENQAPASKGSQCAE